MHKYLVYATYGWLAFAGVSHFIADVLSQYVRGKHFPSVETTLYYGLNTAFAWGQITVGALGLYLAWRAMPVVSSTPVSAIMAIAGLGWLAITFPFMSYWEPKASMSIFCALTFACLLIRS